MLDHQTWCGSTSWHGAVSCTITKSLWPTFFTFIGHQRKTLSRAYLLCYISCRITKLAVVVHHGIAKCRVSLLGHSDIRFGRSKENYTNHIFYAISCRITKFGLVVHHGMVQCCAPLLGHSDLHFGNPKENLVQSIFLSSVNLSDEGWCIGRGHVFLCNTRNTQLTALLLEKGLKFVFQLGNSSFLLLIFSKHSTHCSK